MTDSTAAPAPVGRDLHALEREVRQLLEFAVRRASVKIDDALIDSVIAACRRVGEGTPEVEAELWRQYNQLADMISPATPETVTDICQMQADAERRPAIWRKWWCDHPVRRLFGAAVLWVAISFAMLLATQIVSLLLDNSLERITMAEKNLTEIDDRLATVRKLINEAAETGSDKTGLMEQLLEQKNDLQAKRTAQTTVAQAALIMLPESKTCETGQLTVDKGDPSHFSNRLACVRHQSTILTNIISLLLLPLLYGWMGANVYILRRLLAGLDSWNINTLLAAKFRLRRYLGALIGVTVGLVYQTGAEQFTSAGISLALFAFLSGYSVEFIFSTLDNVINRARSALPDSAQKPGSP